VFAALTIDGRLAATLGGSPPGATLGITGHALVADTATASDRLLAIADVICSASEAPDCWLDRSLAVRWPSPPPQTSCSPHALAIRFASH
jgi:hypothetical protein